jgi:hypothetical protein
MFVPSMAESEQAGSQSDHKRQYLDVRLWVRVRVSTFVVWGHIGQRDMQLAVE